MDTREIINPQKIDFLLAKSTCNGANRVDGKKVSDILARAKTATGLELEEVAALIAAAPEFYSEILITAEELRNRIYGNRIVLFAPLYWSNFCANRCHYCAFRVENKTNKRVRLTLEEVQKETFALLDMGHKRTLIESGEHPRLNTMDYLTDVIRTIYSVVNSKGSRIRRVNVNIAATTVENYRCLARAEIGTYNLFQETYHRPTYETAHPYGTLKGDYERQLFAMNRAIEGGLQDLGLGVLYGLYDWRFEVMAVISHAKYLDRTFGIGPHTISVPRICSTEGVDFTPPYPVSDDDFLKLIAIIRLSVPYTGMVISTRETPEIRLKAFKAGISQTSAGSKTSPGAYSMKAGSLNQFNLHDNRTLDEVTYELLRNGLIPSHCTACECMNRMGTGFLPLAKSGEIKDYCFPNSLLTLKEYLRDYASEQTRKLGEQIIEQSLGGLFPKHRQIVEEWLKRLDKGDTTYLYL